MKMDANFELVNEITNRLMEVASDGCEMVAQFVFLTNYILFGYFISLI